MFTSRSSMPGPGTLEPKRMSTPSSGWTRMTTALLVRRSVCPWENGWYGGRLNTSAISVTRRPSRLPVRR